MTYKIEKCTKKEFFEMFAIPEEYDIDEAIDYAAEVIYYSEAYAVIDEFGYTILGAWKDFCEEFGIRPGMDDWNYCNECHVAEWILESHYREQIVDLYE